MERSKKEHKNKKKKPFTRLQKHAPAALQLAQITTGVKENEDDSDHCAIPLLSPLVLSPTPLLVEDGEEQLAKTTESGNISTREGWQHPAVDGITIDPSKLGALLKSQCVLVDKL
ncbi:hypothetical protein BUALT_Bualt02G0069300 [Buddleja alternifolia]|uniref:Uncharacterized protein n=1 Tax=Buddleja alternifolia TaxID=168488 RepID=A0AAV6Y091_9LAMI|nr:hypothetical protein BUALT_Bualt02G0069300 [Buddleja alternifolia]